MAQRERLVLLHGFTHQEIQRLLPAIKHVVEDPQSIAFAMTTPTNLEWTVAELIREVTEEHKMLTARREPGGREDERGSSASE